MRVVQVDAPGAVPRPSLALLSTLSALSAFGMSVCVPALPALGDSLGARQSVVPLVISAYLLALAVAQPVQGPLADRFGRRPVLLAGFAVFVLASAACAAAPAITVLVAARFVQGVGVSAGTVVSRAVVRDLYDPETTARILSLIAAATSVAPMLAPVIGGALVTVAGWRATFLLASALGLAVLLWAGLRLAETRPAETAGLDPRALLGHFGRLLRSPLFLGHSLVFGCSTGSFFAFMAVAPTVFRDQLGLTPQAFGLCWSLLALSYLLGAATGSRLIPRHGAERMLGLSVAATVVAGISWLPLLALLPPSLPLFLVPMAAVLALSGVTNPLSLAGAVRDEPRIAGTAAGLSSAIGLGASGVFTILAGALFDGTALRMALGVAVVTTLEGAFYLLVRPKRG